MNLENLLQDLLYEGNKNDINKNTLKIFYNVDVLLQNFPKEEEDNTEETPQGDAVPGEGEGAADLGPAPLSAPSPPQSESVINEEIIKFKNEGTLEVPNNKVDNIQTLLDLLDYVKDSKKSGKTILNSVIIEVISVLAGIGERGVDDVINKGDKVLINLDYGMNLQNSVGLRVNKVAGSDAVSLSLKSHNKILPHPFNLNEFNRQLIYFRNATLNK